MLVSMKEILEAAREGGYGVTAPNIYNADTIRVAVEAAEELRAPQILDIHFGMCPGNFSDVAAIAVDYAKNASVPVAINLDHGADFEQAVVAIHNGLSSVMVDRSSLPFEENVAQVSEIVKIAHACGVSVESELGHVGFGASYDPDDTSNFTDPSMAKEFVDRTGIDCLAVAVGTAHGNYASGKTPKLDFERIKTLRDVTGIPLVLHGCSGTGDENLKKAIECGITKLNLFFDMNNNVYAKIKELDDMYALDISKLQEVIRVGYKEKLVHYMKLFGQCGKA